MKIRLKLTLIFTCITTLILIGVSVAIYYFFSWYRQIEFYGRLEDRALVAAQASLGADNLSREVLRKVQEKYKQVLPNEEIGIFEENYSLAAMENSLDIALPPNFHEELARNRYIELKSGDRQGVALWYEDNQGNFITIVSAIDQFGIHKLADLQKILVICFLVSILVIFISGIFFSQHALRPITSLVKDINRIGLSNLHSRLAVQNSKDEIAELATTFNQMLERMETSLEIQKNFINNASHELKNPLTAIIGEVELMLQKDRPVHEYKGALQTIAFEARRLDYLIIKLLHLAQTSFDKETMLNDTVRMDELIISVYEDLRQLVPDNKVHIHFESIPENEGYITLRGNKQLLHAALINVMENACKFSNNQVVDVLIKADAHTLSVIITDRGIGIAHQDIRNIFQPFYRANNARAYKGSGIGLSLTEKIIRMHGGDIQVESVLEKGTQFTISFEQHVSLPLVMST